MEIEGVRRVELGAGGFVEEGVEGHSTGQRLTAPDILVLFDQPSRS